MKVREVQLHEARIRSEFRRALLEGAKESLERGDLQAALSGLISVTESLSASEDRVASLHAECVAMLEQASKILELDAARRPVVVQLPPAVPLEAPPEENGP